ncbi:MAG: 2-methylcitrate dehydratase [Syntrophorhabdus sp. PtaU1.Bin058]|nr:MAG: 2-methylcitrate dehydratase [Syntrophorhabdus sp. PtaU1.Bin058]
MKTEKRIVEYLCRAAYKDFQPEPLSIVKNQLLTVIGTTIAGSAAEGCKTLAQIYRELDGKEEATILIHGGKVPAQNAAFVNGAMARALDFCDAMAPGAHVGSAIVPSALAAAELAGGCSGQAFLTALALGTEMGIRFNLNESAYDGFDPTGVCVVFAATATAARILGLNEAETWNALALAFNRSGGSFQSNVDGALAVRVIQGWVAETGIICARLASRGITGPKNFLEGIYGYFHLFGRDRIKPEAALEGLGTPHGFEKVVFKKYPSCGLTQGCTEMTLSLVREHDINPGEIDRIEVRVPSYAYKLVGHPFEIGDNPKVNAQFSIRYCVANALLRRSSNLRHFEESSIRDPKVLELAAKVSVVSDPGMEKRDHTSTDMIVRMAGGKEHVMTMEISPGAAGNPLTQKEHEERFRDCIGFAETPLQKDKVEKIIETVNNIETIDDVRAMVPMLLL